VTWLDRRHRDGCSWTDANDVEPLIHGAAYFPELLRCVLAMRAGDLLLFTDWRGDPDQLLDGPGTEVSRVLSEAAERGVVVKGLIWRSHLDRFAFSEQQNRHLGEDIEAAGGECLRDMRCDPADRTTRSSSCCAIPAARNWTSPLSAASTCATADLMDLSMPEIRSASRWRTPTARGRRGTMCSWRSAGLRLPTWKRCSVNGGMIRPR
jgi:hypothetical protein